MKILSKKYEAWLKYHNKYTAKQVIEQVLADIKWIEEEKTKQALTLTDVVSSAKNKEAIISLMKTMTDDERLDIITEFCKYCGGLDSGCQCWNDE